jgi:hypothetical protein
MIFHVNIALNAVSKRTAFRLNITICNIHMNVQHECVVACMSHDWIFIYLTCQLDKHFEKW